MTENCCTEGAALLDGWPRVVLKRGKARLFQEQTPTVYRGAVDFIACERTARTGEAAVLVDAMQNPIGWGVYNATSMFCLRILQWTPEMDDASSIEEIIKARIEAAVELRKALGLPSSETTIYRLINSEGDRLSGMVADVYGDHIVVASSAAWIQLNQVVIEDALRMHTKIDSVVWRPSHELLSLEGIESTSQPSTEAGLPASEGNLDEGEAGAAHHTTAVENGISYRVDLRHGQKTGFYADQRHSRALISKIAAQKTVLDLCCYTGGFALSALDGGATQVIGVDSSAAAIKLAEENAEMLNASVRPSFVKSQIESFMRAAAAEGRQWDLIILDPAKLAPNKAALPRARAKYVKLNSAAIRITKPGGLLMTCSCSGAVAQGTGLLPIVEEAARAVGRKLTLLRSTGAGPDHPLDPAYPEGRYLTNLLFRVS